jgi:outer membrane protein assembly factor BamB
VDTPPTVHNGFCLAGCHDGYVYALSAKDGRLAWRARVAPAERRMMAYGEIESVWPSVGSVLVHEGAAYAHAGRTSESDGGIAVVAFDPATGVTSWAKAIAPGPLRMNDLLFVRDGSIGWHHVRLDPKTGNAAASAPVSNDASQGGIMDHTWTLVGKRRSGNAFAVGKGNEKKQQTMTDLLAWNDAVVASPAFAAARDKVDGAVGPLKPQDFSWRPGIPGGGQVEAVALSGDAVLYAGRIRDPKAGAPGGFLVVLSASDGKKRAEFPLEAPPAYDGIAVARERVYVSLQNGTVACFGK